MQELVFATNNPHKLAEIRRIVGDKFKILSLRDIGCTEDIPETADTLKGNAWQKARYIKTKYGYDCFADDTGLMVDTLEGAPGVYSARYAGENHDALANMELLLENMNGKQNRKAHFSTIIALIFDGEEYTFEGRVDGKILEQPRGSAGFGYDPVFMPEDTGKSFAEMDSDEKNKISHRGRATEKLINFLTSK